MLARAASLATEAGRSPPLNVPLLPGGEDLEHAPHSYQLLHIVTGRERGAHASDVRFGELKVDALLDRALWQSLVALRLKLSGPADTGPIRFGLGMKMSGALSRHAVD